MSLITFQDLPSTSTPINAANLNGNFDYLDDVEEITSSITFNESVTGNTHFYKKGNMIFGYLQGEGKSHSASDTIVSNIPNEYRPIANFFVPFIKNNLAYGILKIAPEGNIVINQISSSASGRIYSTFSYFIS